jgi:hypothetical protein
MPLALAGGIFIYYTLGLMIIPSTISQRISGYQGINIYFLKVPRVLEITKYNI